LSGNQTSSVFSRLVRAQFAHKRFKDSDSLRSTSADSLRSVYCVSVAPAAISQAVCLRRLDYRLENLFIVKD